MGRYQAKGRGLISALHEQLEVQLLWDLPGRRAGEVRARESCSPTLEPSLPGLPLGEGNPHSLVPSRQESSRPSWISDPSGVSAVMPRVSLLLTELLLCDTRNGHGSHTHIGKGRVRKPSPNHFMRPIY